MYGISTNEKAKKKRGRIHFELEKIYRNGDKYLSKDADILFDVFNKHKQLSTVSIASWLNMYRGLLQGIILEERIEL